MSQPESVIRTRVLQALRKFGGFAIAVENPAYPGTPDVWWSGGDWIEIKQVPAPKRPETVVDVPKYKPHQRLWARQCAEAGGRCWFLIRVGQEYLLLWGPIAADYVGTTNLEGLKAVATAWWPQAGGLDRDLGQVLKRYSP